MLNLLKQSRWTVCHSGRPGNATRRSAARQIHVSEINPTLLAISSTVAVGHVGLAAITPTLNLIGRTVAALPTITLSNHPGFAHASGRQTDPSVLTAMIDALDANGWLGQFSTILTGYLPSAAHVTFATSAIERIRQRNPAVRVICDPVLGDDPAGLYIDKTAAQAIREDLIPQANVLLPNRFELAWITDRSIATPHEAIAAAETLGPQRTIAKSIPLSANHICNLEITPGSAASVAIARRSRAPNGTGDMLSALIAADWPLPRATAALGTVIDASLGANHLAIVAAADAWRSAPSLPSTPLTGNSSK